ncbi:MAG: hypothetical protein ACK56I_10530, partial [bacterium]
AQPGRGLGKLSRGIGECGLVEQLAVAVSAPGCGVQRPGQRHLTQRQADLAGRIGQPAGVEQGIARRAVATQTPGLGTPVLRSSGRRWCLFDKGPLPVIILSLIRHASITQFS